MQRIWSWLQSFALTLWCGGLWTVGLLVTPTLFSALDDRALAGTLAGKMLHGMGWIGILCGAYLVLYELVNFQSGCLRRIEFWLAGAMLSLTLVTQFWLQPLVASLRSLGATAVVEQAARFAMWHGVSGAVYLLVSLLAVFLAIGSRRSG